MGVYTLTTCTYFIRLDGESSGNGSFTFTLTMHWQVVCLHVSATLSSANFSSWADIPPGYHSRSHWPGNRALHLTLPLYVKEPRGGKAETLLVVVILFDYTVITGNGMSAPQAGLSLGHPLQLPFPVSICNGSEKTVATKACMLRIMTLRCEGPGSLS